MRTKTIKQTIFIRADPEDVYNILINPKKHSTLTNSLAKGTNKLGEFLTYDGYSYGENLELKKAQKIVQTWGCEDFPEGHFTEVTFELKPEKGGTRLTFTQKKVPLDNYKSISEGWKEFYWKPLTEMFGG